jgi:hypothetical protein
MSSTALQPLAIRHCGGVPPASEPRASDTGDEATGDGEKATVDGEEAVDSHSQATVDPKGPVGSGSQATVDGDEAIGSRSQTIGDGDEATGVCTNLKFGSEKAGRGFWGWASTFTDDFFIARDLALADGLFSWTSAFVLPHVRSCGAAPESAQSKPNAAYIFRM